MFSYRGPAAREATHVDLALAEMCRDLRAAIEPGLETIRAICDRAAPIVAETVSDVRRGSWFYSQDPVSSLRSYFVCGPASETLGLVLATGGVTVGRARTTSLGDDYPSPDHQFLIAECRGDRIVIDPAYHQFLKPFGEKARDWPDILVARASDIGSLATKLASMAEAGESLSVRALRNMELHVRPLDSNREALAQYFERIWNVDRGAHALERPGCYARDIELYNSGEIGKIDPDRTTYLRLLKTRKLI